MPRHYKKYKRKKKTYHKNPVISRTLAPRTRRFKLRYVQPIQMNPGIGSMAVQYFSANGLFDPYVTGVGHQPLGFDQYMSMYDHYVVTKSKCTVYTENSDNDPVVLGIYLNDDTTLIPTNVNEMNEQPNTKWRYLSSVVSGHNSSGTVTKTFNTSKDLGRKSVLSDPQLKGSTTANPTEQMFFSIYLGTFDTTVDHGAQELQVIIEYDGYFIEPKDLGQS